MIIGVVCDYIYLSKIKFSLSQVRITEIDLISFFLSCCCRNLFLGIWMRDVGYSFTNTPCATFGRILIPFLAFLEKTGP